MQIVRIILKLAVAAGLVAMVAAGCGQKEETMPATPPVPAKKTELKKQIPSGTIPMPVVNPVAPKQPAMAMNPAEPGGDEPTPSAAELEKSYLKNPEFTDRVQVIFQLSDLGTSEALTALGRLFQKEPDPDLRIQVLNSLFDIEGQDEKKVVLLAAGAATNQPKEVRDAAIDALGDIDAKRAVPILQALLNDSDEDIRDHAKDTLEQLQSQEAMQK